MAKQQSGRRTVVRLIEQGRQPAYLLNADRQIVYCNESLLRWAQSQEKELVGKTCVFNAEVGAESERHAGLSPPPEAFEKPISWGTVWTASGEAVSRRDAVFVELTDDDAARRYLWVVLDAVDLADHEETQFGDASDWHQKLLKSRAQRLGTDWDWTLSGDSPRIRLARQQCELAASSSSSFTIVGPTQTHKAVIAKQILERRTQRLGVPWASIDAGVLDAELMRATLQGVVGRGNVAILIESTDLLDRDTQQLVAEFFHQHTEATAVATASKCLTTQETFDAELAALLSTTTIDLPRLADRLEDIPWLIQTLLGRANCQYPEKQLSRASESVVEALVAHPWSTDQDLNTLEEFVFAACRSAKGPVVQLGDLPELVGLTADAELYDASPCDSIDLDAFLDSVERELIRRAIRQSKGNRAEAARKLGISRARLLRRLDAKKDGEMDGDGEFRQL